MMKHGKDFDAVSVDAFNLLVNVISERDGYSFKRCAECYATNGHLLTGLDSYDVTSLKQYEEYYGLETLIETLEAYAEWYDEYGKKEGAENDTNAEGTV